LIRFALFVRNRSRDAAQVRAAQRLEEPAFHCKCKKLDSGTKSSTKLGCIRSSQFCDRLHSNRLHVEHLLCNEGVFLERWQERRRGAKGIVDIELLKQHLRPIASLEAGQERPSAAVAVILDPDLDGGSVLLIKRRERKSDAWSGQIAFPGGHMSKNDTTPLQAAIRETSEEVGISLLETELLGCLHPMHSRTRMVLVAPFVFLMVRDSVVSLSDEVTESFWVPLDALFRMRVIKRKVEDEGSTLIVDSYVHGGHVIWGLTFRIINELLNKK